MHRYSLLVVRHGTTAPVLALEVCYGDVGVGLAQDGHDLGFGKPRFPKQAAGTEWPGRILGGPAKGGVRGWPIERNPDGGNPEDGTGIKTDRWNPSMGGAIPVIRDPIYRPQDNLGALIGHPVY